MNQNDQQQQQQQQQQSIEFKMYVDYPSSSLIASVETIQKTNVPPLCDTCGSNNEKETGVTLHVGINGHHCKSISYMDADVYVRQRSPTQATTPKQLSQSLESGILSKRSSSQKKRSMSLAVIGGSIKQLIKRNGLVDDADSQKRSPNNCRLYKEELESSYECMKFQYKAMSAMDVIEAERRRKSDVNIFSPKLILEHLKKEGKLSSNWQVDLELIILKEKETKGTWMNRIENLLYK
jgi:hypothetical protein